jgi:hypothetical protein
MSAGRHLHFTPEFRRWVGRVFVRAETGISDSRFAARDRGVDPNSLAAAGGPHGPPQRPRDVCRPGSAIGVALTTLPYATTWSSAARASAVAGSIRHEVAGAGAATFAGGRANLAPGLRRGHRLRLRDVERAGVAAPMGRRWNRARTHHTPLLRNATACDDFTAVERRSARQRGSGRAQEVNAGASGSFVSSA